MSGLWIELFSSFRTLKMLHSHVFVIELANNRASM